MPESTTGLRERVTGIISDQFDVPSERIRPEATFADLDLDSLALIELAAVLEEELDVQVTDQSVTMNDTLGKVLELLEAKGAAS
ncbi:acyl carrier protein [Actinomadura rubrisoli]|uniref:Acyl carrier protein n=1 Tax=Actinomadura rubrisoli TaxID=2530368 RepID=A0A4R5CHX7_9ACTN|nr:phosphopantetheine-binding protein [Actinomadura rubrisoli]TDD98140.1 acyl carrier protein [Actinomadura rubrisoli]